MIAENRREKFDVEEQGVEEQEDKEQEDEEQEETILTRQFREVDACDRKGRYRGILASLPEFECLPSENETPSCFFRRRTGRASCSVDSDIGSFWK